MTAVAQSNSRFVHEAVYYKNDDTLVAGLIPFIEQGLERDEPVLIAMPPQNLLTIQNHVNGQIHDTKLKFVDMTHAGRNPARIIPNVLLAFVRQHRGRRVRIIGEPIWKGRTPLEYPACLRHEALINLALADADLYILCPYDTVGLDATALADAARTHPFAGEPGQIEASPHYRGALPVVDDCNQPLPPLPPDATVVPVHFSALAQIRDLVTDQALAGGLSPERAIELTIAVNELTTNTVLHGGGRGELAMWTENGHLACQVSDTGFIADPLAGRVPPLPDDPNGGRGLLLVHQLCDLVRIYTRPGATSIRALMSR